MKKFILFIFLILACSEKGTEYLAEESFLLDSMESKNISWKSTGELSRSAFFATSGEHSYLLEWEGSEKIEIVTKPHSFETSDGDAAYLKLDIYNASENEIRTSLKLQSSGKTIKSGTRKLSSGWNRDVEFLLYKYPHKNRITLSAVEEICFLFSGSGQNRLYLDNLRGGYLYEGWDVHNPENAVHIPAVKNEVELKITLKKPVVEKIECYSLLELDIQVNRVFVNPYDPDEVRLEAIFKSPEGREIRVPGFFYVPYYRTYGVTENLRQTEAGFWKVRFTPPSEGVWEAVAELFTQEGGARTPVIPFRVEPGQSHGFVRSAEDSPYFRFDDQSLYLPIGSNVAWYDKRATGAYNVWFHKMANAGANFARVWMAPWGFSQEWKDTGLGNYSGRQMKAWQLDYLFKMAEESGIYLMLTLINHGQFSRHTNAEWQDNPYNIANGGPLERPEQFFSHPEARRLFKQRLRYIIARWGYSPALMAWEWWNEVNLAENLSDPGVLVPWLSEMTAYLKELDYCNHLVTNSFSVIIPGDQPEWQDMDIVQIHKYNSQNWARSINIALTGEREKSSKPFLVGEFGLQQEIIDPQGIHFHNGMWSALFSGAAGTAMLWWWDTYIEPQDLYYHFTGIKRFFLEDDRLKKALLSGSIVPAPISRSGEAEIYSLKGDDSAYLWIKDQDYSYDGFLSMALGSGLKNVRFKKIAGFSLALKDLNPGEYSVTFMDSLTGAIVSEERVIVSGELVIGVPAFSGDVACKIVRR